MPATAVVELMAKLADAIKALEAQLAQMDSVSLQALEARLPRNAPPGSPEMVTLVLLYRELGIR